MKKTFKYIFLGSIIFLVPKVSHALTGPFVQITTGTLQPGTTNGFYVSSGTAVTFNVTGGATMTVVAMPDSLSSAPALHRKLGATTGMYTTSTPEIGFSVAGTTVAFYRSDGVHGPVNIFSQAFFAGGTGPTGVHTTGEFRLFPPTASLGFVTFAAANNSGNTTTTEQWAAQGGARTYTHVDFGQSGNYAVSTSTGPQFILKRVQCTVTASSSTTTSTFVDSNLTCTITPSQATSVVRVSVSGELLSNGAAGTTAAATLARGGSNLLGTSGFAIAENQSAGTASGLAPASLAAYYDSPASTSALTYSVQIKRLSGSPTATWCQTSQTCIMVLEEVGQ